MTIILNSSKLFKLINFFATPSIIPRMQNKTTFEDPCKNNDLIKLQILIKIRSSPENSTYFGVKHKMLEIACKFRHVSVVSCVIQNLKSTKNYFSFSSCSPIIHIFTKTQFPHVTS